MGARQLHNKPRWSREDYADALLILRGATVEGTGGREYKVFKGLTKRNGFDANRPETITRSKRHTIKKLLSDLATIRTRRTIAVAPRKTRRRTQAKNATGFRSPYMNAYPIPVLPSVQARVKFTKNDKPIVEYPRQGTKTLVVPVNRSQLKRVMTEIERDEDADIEDIDEAIADTVQAQIKKGLKELAPYLQKDDLIRFRLQTVHGGLEPGNRMAVSADSQSLVESLAEFINQYLEKDQEGNFFVGFSIWASKPGKQSDKIVGQSFKRPGGGRVKESSAARKRRRIKGR